MPKPSFLQSFLGRPSRSYADPSNYRANDDPYYGQHSHFPSHGYPSSLDLNYAGSSRRAHSTVSYAGPSRGYRHHAPRPPSPTSASDIGTSRGRLVSNSSLFDGDIPPLPPQVHFNPPRREWDIDEFEEDMSATPPRSPDVVPDFNYGSHKRPAISRSRPNYAVTGQAPVPPRPPPEVSSAKAKSSETNSTRLSKSQSSAYFADMEPARPTARDHSHFLQSSFDSTSGTDIVSPQPTKPAPSRPPVMEAPGLEPVQEAPRPKPSKVVSKREPVQVAPREPAKVAPHEPIKVAPREPAKVVPRGPAEVRPSPESPADLKALASKPETAPLPAGKAGKPADGTVSEYDIFYTPRSSFHFDKVPASDDEDEEDEDVETPSANVTGLPVFNVQPPTPATGGDAIESPFREDSEYLSPDHARRGRSLSSEEEESDDDYSDDDEDDDDTISGDSEEETGDVEPLAAQVPADPLPKVAATTNGHARPAPHPQLLPQPAVRSVAQPIAQPVAQPIAQPVAQPIAQPVVQPIAQPVVQPIAQPVAQPNSQPVAQPVAQPMSQPVAQPLAQPTPPPARPARRRVTLVEPEPESSSSESEYSEHWSGPDDDEEPESESEPELVSKPEPKPAPQPVLAPQQRAPATPRQVIKPSTTGPKASQPKPTLKPPKVFPIEEDNLPPPPIKTKHKKPSAGGKVHGASMTIVAASSSPKLKPTTTARPLSRSGSRRTLAPAVSDLSLSRSSSVRSNLLSPPVDSRPASRAGSVRSKPPPIEPVQIPLVTSPSMPLDRPSSRASTSRVSSRPGRTPIESEDYTLTRSKSARSVKSNKSTKSSKSSKSMIRTDKGLPPIPPKAQSDIGVPTSAYEHVRTVSPGSRAGSEQSNSSFRSNGVRGAGYGKGGWAAASAEPVVMYMPAEGDGWAAFHPLPPRSRATPLPGSSRSSLYDLDRSRSPSNSAASSILGLGASASLDGRVTYQNTPGAGPPTQWIRHSPGSSVSGRVNPTPPRAMSPLAQESSAMVSYPSPPASVLEAEQGSNQGSPEVAPGSLPSEDESSDDGLPAPSRSYSAVPKATSELSYDYASDHHTSRATSQNSSPAKHYDGSGREQRWAPPDYDPYAYAPPGRVNISPVLPNMPRSRSSLPVMPRSVSVSSRSSAHDSEYSQTTPRMHNSPLSRMSLPGFPQQTNTHPNIFPGRPLSPAESFYSSNSRPISPAGSAPMPSFARSMSPPPRLSPYEVAAQAHAERMGLRPSTLNPDILTVLPEMSESDSNQLYLPQEPRHKHRFSSSVSEAGGIRRSSSLWGKTKYTRSENGNGLQSRPTSESGRPARYSMSENGHYAQSEASEGRSNRPRISLNDPLPRPKSRGGSTVGDMGTLMESSGYEEPVKGYTNLYVPQASSYKPLDPVKGSVSSHPHIFGLPQTSMAAITVSSALHTYLLRDDAPTPVHLRHTLPPPVDFTSHVKPPDKVSAHQLMVEVYAVAVDWVDIAEIDRKDKEDVGKWIPGRSFIGRCMAVGVDEKEYFRGDLLVGLLSIKKSGALCEYMSVDRRHCARVNPQTTLSVAELAALPSQGIAAHRAIRESMLSRGMQALIMDAHEGIPALMCQELTRKGIAVTAVIPGGAGHAEAQAACMQHGARGVLTGSPVSVLQSLEEGLFHLVVDTQATAGIYEAAKRSLVNGGRLISLASARPPVSPSSTPKRGFKGVFSSRQKETKRIVYEYVHPAGAGEPEVDASGLDYRDILEEPIMGVLRPVVSTLVPFERGAEVFRGKRMTDRGHVAVVRLVN